MMMELVTFIVSLFLISATQAATPPSGSVELDEVNFDKIISKFDAALVKFDVAFPYGDKHDAFIALARDTTDVDEFLVAEVGVKDYGEKDNEALASKYGATKDDFPVVKLFIKGKKEPVPFDESAGFSTDELRKFVRKHTGIYLSLPGCVREMDMLAIEFMKNKDDRSKILKEVDEAQKQLVEKNAAYGKTYKTIMERIIEKGDEFVFAEYERVNKLLGSKISDEKKKAMGLRLNILQTFQLHKNMDASKSEL